MRSRELTVSVGEGILGCPGIGTDGFLTRDEDGWGLVPGIGTLGMKVGDAVGVMTSGITSCWMNFSPISSFPVLLSVLLRLGGREGVDGWNGLKGSRRVTGVVGI